MRILPVMVIMAYLLCALSGGLVVRDMLQPRGMAESVPCLTVVLPAYEASTSRIAPFGPGYDRELLGEFTQGYPCHIKWVHAEDRTSALKMLADGRADVAMGFVGDVFPPAGVTAGPDYYHAKQVAALLPAESDKPLQAERFLLDMRSWDLWEPFAPVLDEIERKSIGERESYHWFWRTYNPSLQYALTNFWARLMHPKNSTLAELEERYYGYFPRKRNPSDILDVMHIVKQRLPQYSEMIVKASRKTTIDPLLFIAVVIQESRMDESTVSHTGVRGIMQLTTRTAAFLKVDRMDPQAALAGGARYLQMLWDRLEPMNLDSWDRWFFTLAAFNQGPKRLNGAIALAQKLGGTGRTWAELKRIYPLMSQKKYADMIGQSTCRGYEAVDFVARVRWNYHVLRGLIALDRPEAQHLTPLLGDSQSIVSF